MAWIESHQTLGRHPKLLQLADSLKCSPPTAVGHLHYLWWWALDYAQDGDLTEHDDRTIARAAEWRRNPQVFVGALLDSGFLNGDRTVHDWWDYAGRMLAKREANAARMREARAANVQRTSGARAGATVPNRTVPNQPTSTSPSPAANGSARAKDELFEAIVAACGWDLADLTTDARGRANAATKQLRALYSDAPETVPQVPGLVLGFALQWREHYPGTNITPQAITSHWADYMGGGLAEPARRIRR